MLGRRLLLGSIPLVTRYWIGLLIREGREGEGGGDVMVAVSLYQCHRQSRSKKNTRAYQ